MGSLFGPKCFLSSAFFILTILSIYGVVGPIYNYLQTTQLQDIGEWPFNIRPLYFAFIIIQCMFPVAGFFAILAAGKKRPIFLLGSGSVLLAIFTCSTVFGIVSYRVSPKEILDSYYKTFRRGMNNSAVFEWMNDIQWQHKCCGVYSHMDWYTVDNFLVENSIPSTCCRRDISPHNKNCGKDVFSNDTNKTLEEIIYTEGCGTNLAKTRSQLLEHLAIEICISGAISLFVAIFLYMGVTRFFLAGENSCSSSSNHDTDHGHLSSNSRGNAYMQDENNNFTASGNNFQARRKQSALEKRNKRRDEKFNGQHPLAHGPFGSLHNQRKFGRSEFPSLRGNISKSKSFIIGEAPSHLLTPIHEEKDPEILRKNVDMLWYQSLDKNMSTLSTTPNDISSMLLPAMILQNKKTGLGCELPNTTTNDDEAAPQQSTVNNMVGERPFTPNISQNGSSAIVNNNAIKLPILPPSEVVGTERYNHAVPDEIREENESPLPPSPVAESAFVTAQLSPEIKIDQIVDEDKTVEGGVSGSVNEDPLSQVNPVNVSVNPLQPGSKYNPTSSVRSSTLATIQEESESAKGSPNNTKGASPASDCLTPENVSPQETRTELCSTSDKDENAVSCAFEVNLTNNNTDNFHSIADVEPEPTV